MKYSERAYPKWFIDELVNEEDKEKARNGILKSTDRVKFKCSKDHLYDQRVCDHIRLSSGQRVNSCPDCGHLTRYRKRSETISKNRTYPQWFLDELVDNEDKEKAKNKELKLTDRVKLKCNKNHIYESLVHDHIKLSTGEKKHGCPLCIKHRSRIELEIEDYIKLLGYSTIHKRFNNVKNFKFEVDIFIPEKMYV